VAIAEFIAASAKMPDVAGTRVVLAPWPNDRDALAAATAALKAALDPDLDDARVQALGEAAAARVQKEAPGAPQAVKNEACVRFAGYLNEADFGTVESESIGPGTINYQRNHAGAFRLCGAYGLIAPWKVRRGGAIG